MLTNVMLSDDYITAPLEDGLSDEEIYHSSSSFSENAWDDYQVIYYRCYIGNIRLSYQHMVGLLSCVLQHIYVKSHDSTCVVCFTVWRWGFYVVVQWIIFCVSTFCCSPVDSCSQ